MRTAVLAALAFSLAGCSDGRLNMTDSGPGGSPSWPTNPASRADGGSLDLRITVLEFEWDELYAQGYVLYESADSGFSDGVRTFKSDLLIHPDPSRPVLTRTWATESAHNGSQYDAVCSALWEWPMSAPAGEPQPLVRITAAPKLLQEVGTGLCLPFGLVPRRIVLGGDRQEAVMSPSAGDGQLRFKRKTIGIGSPWIAIPGGLPVLKSPEAEWTGSRVLVFGKDPEGSFHLGALDPENPIWEMPEAGTAPSFPGPFAHALVDGRLIVTDGLLGAIYDPSTKAWTALPMDGAPFRREGVGQVVKATVGDGKLFLWVSTLLDTRPFSAKHDLGVYDLATGEWRAIGGMPPLGGHMVERMVWLGTEAVVWFRSLEGGRDKGLRFFWQAPSFEEIDPGGTAWDLFEVHRVGGRLLAAGYDLRSERANGSEPIESRGPVALFDPLDGSWKKDDYPEYRVEYGRSRVVTEAGILGFGGIDKVLEPIENAPGDESRQDALNGDFAYYNASRDDLYEIPALAGSLSPRSQAAMAWTGRFAVVWGGCVRSVDLKCSAWAGDGALMALDLF